jgi:hypothetical protein
MSRFDDIRAALIGTPSEEYRARRMGVGLGVAGGFVLAFAAYILTANAWWFLAPIVGFVAAWRVVMGRWPFLD